MAPLRSEESTPASRGPSDHDKAIFACTTKTSRIATYGLIGGQHLFNYLSRFAIPYIVPHMVTEFGFSDVQRSSILNAFTPGYILTQIPAAPLCAGIGGKTVLTLNNIGLLASLLALPAAARRGAGAVWACIAVMGIMQGPFIVAQGAMTSSWVPSGPVRSNTTSPHPTPPALTRPTPPCRRSARSRCS